MKPLEVSEETAEDIIKNRTPLGIFYFKNGNTFVGIDNSGGESFVEEFKYLSICLAWLNYEIVEYHTGRDFNKSLQQLRKEDSEKYGNIYEVIIKETLVKSVSIDASSRQEAIDKVKEFYEDEIFVLDFNDFNDASFYIDE